MKPDRQFGRMPDGSAAEVDLDSYQLLTESNYKISIICEKD